MGKMAKLHYYLQQSPTIFRLIDKKFTIELLFLMRADFVVVVFPFSLYVFLLFFLLVDSVESMSTFRYAATKLMKIQANLGFHSLHSSVMETGLKCIQVLEYLTIY